MCLVFVPQPPLLMHVPARFCVHPAKATAGRCVTDTASSRVGCARSYGEHARRVAVMQLQAKRQTEICLSLDM